MDKSFKKQDIIDAIHILRAFLLNGPRSYCEVKTYFKKFGYSKSILKAAKKDIGVKVIKSGQNTIWELQCSDGEI